MIEGLLLPELDEWSAPFFAFAAAGELRVQRCEACGCRRMPPGPRCASCGGDATTWELLSGDATIWSFAVPHPPLLPAYASVAPYNVVVVATVEDPTVRFCGNLVTTADGALDEVDPASIRLGESVRVAFPQPVDEIVLPRWVRR